MVEDKGRFYSKLVEASHGGETLTGYSGHAPWTCPWCPSIGINVHCVPSKDNIYF